MSELDTVITVTNTDNYQCYACLEVKNRMIKLCQTDGCTGRICNECVTQQIRNKDKKCGLCRGDAIVSYTINLKKCGVAYGKMIYLWFMFVVGSISIFLNALGKTVVGPWIRCGGGDVNCDDLGVLLIFLTFPFLLLFFQNFCCNDCNCCPCCYNSKRKCWRYDLFCCSFRDKIKYKTYISLFLMICITNIVIMIAHFIGYFIVKYKFGRDDFYTWRTSLAGFVVYWIVIGFGILCFVIYHIYECLMFDAGERFGKVEYGQVMGDEFDMGERLLDDD
jgi:hypothetical protein